MSTNERIAELMDLVEDFVLNGTKDAKAAVEAHARKMVEGERVYLVATGETLEGRETYTRHKNRPPFCDAETLYATPQPAPAVQPAPSIQQLAAGAFYPQVTGFSPQPAPAPQEVYRCNICGGDVNFSAGGKPSIDHKMQGRVKPSATPQVDQRAVMQMVLKCLEIGSEKKRDEAIAALRAALAAKEQPESLNQQVRESVLMTQQQKENHEALKK